MSCVKKVVELLHQHVLLPETDEFDELFLFEETGNFETREEILTHLIHMLPLNRIVTPETIVDIGISEYDIDYICRNESWCIDDIIEMVNTSPISNQRILRRIFERSDIQEHHVSQFEGFNMENFISCIPISYDQIIEIIRSHGDFVECLENTRIIQDLMRNPHVNIGDIINAAASTGYPDVVTTWPQNICMFPKEFKRSSKSIYSGSYNWFANRNSDVIYELVDILQSNERYIGSSSDHSEIYIMFDCLSILLLDNPSWNPEMESRFGKFIWDLFWKFATCIYGENRGMASLEYRHEVIDYIRMQNPSWLTPSSMRKHYTEGTFPKFMKIKPLDKYASLYGSWGGGNTNGNCLYLFRDIYECSVAKKSMDRKLDMVMIMRNRPSIDILRRFVREISFHGDDGIRLGSILYRKYILPRRYEKILKLAREILVKEECGKRILDCKDLMDGIVSYVGI